MRDIPKHGAYGAHEMMILSTEDVRRAVRKIFPHAVVDATFEIHADGSASGLRRCCDDGPEDSSAFAMSVPLLCELPLNHSQQEHAARDGDKDRTVIRWIKYGERIVTVRRSAK